jgi:hypothetical protein
MHEEPIHHAPQPAAPPAPRLEPSVPVVKVYSVRGVEYGLMTFMVWFGAAAIVWCLLALVNNQSSFDVLAMPVALLLTTLPVFGYLFTRLRKAELANPALRYEPSKRRFSQLSMFVSFFICFFNIVSFVYLLLSSTTEDSYSSIGKSALNLLVILAVVGGIFAYYWVDEHRLTRR